MAMPVRFNTMFQQGRDSFTASTKQSSTFLFLELKYVKLVNQCVKA